MDYIHGRAGGMACDSSRGDDYLQVGNIVAGNPKTLAAILDVIQTGL